MKRVASVTTIVLSTLASLLLLWQLRSVVYVFLFALALAAAMSGPVNFLMQKGWSRSWAVITSFVVFTVGVLLFILLVTWPLLSEIDPLVRNLILEYARIQETMLRLSGSRANLATHLPSTSQLAASWVGDNPSQLIQNLLGITQSIGSILSQFFLGLIMSLYWMLDQLRFERLWLSLLAPENRIRARDTWRKIEHDIGSYLRSEFIQFLLSALLLTAGFWLLNVKQPVLLALFGALTWLVPLIGAFFAVIGAALIGWLTGVDVSVAAAVYTIVVLVGLEFYVEPRLYRHERYWNVLVLLVMLILGDTLGWVGLLVAPPTALAIQIILNQLLDKEPVTLVAAPAASSVLVTPTPDFSSLSERMEVLDTQLKSNEAGGSLRTNSLFDRLRNLVAKVKEETEATVAR